MVYIYESTTAVFFRSYCVTCYKCEVYLGLLIQVKSDLLILYITIVSTINRLYFTKLNSLVLLAFTILKLKTYLIPNMVISNLKYLFFNNGYGASNILLHSDHDRLLQEKFCMCLCLNCPLPRLRVFSGNKINKNMSSGILDTTGGHKWRWWCIQYLKTHFVLNIL